MNSPLAIELFAGTMSGTAAWCEMGGRAVGFDLAYEPYHGTPHPLARRVIQDVLTLDGAQFKDADFLWGSSPCQAYSYLAMPWSRSKCPLCKGKKHYFAWQVENRPPANMADWGEPIPCDCKENSAKAKELRRKWELDGPDNALFDSVSRIQREASAAAGRYIPFIQENVRGAVPWIGKRDMSLERWKSLTQEEKIKAGRPDAVFGSYFLWGSCGQIGRRVIAGRDLADIRAGRGRFGVGVKPEKGELKGHGNTWFGIQSNGDTYDQREVNPVSGNKGTNAVPNRGWTAGCAITLGLENYNNGVKCGGLKGDDWFAHHNRNSFGHKVPGFRFDGSGRSFQSATVEAHGTKANPDGTNHPTGSWFRIADSSQGDRGQKIPTYSDPRRNGGKGVHLTSPAENQAGTKIGGDGFRDPACHSKHGSRSNARKAASAMIAKIPPALSEYIARVNFPWRAPNA